MTNCVMTVFMAGLLLSIVPAAEEKKDDTKKDQEALQGTWKAVSSEQGGKEQGDEAKEHTLTFEKDTFTVKRGDQVQVKGTFKLDPSKKPKAIDMTVTESRRDEHKGKEMHGIYEMTKDGLKWCTSMPGDTDRPKEFSTKEGTRDLCVTLKKDKP
jgi:uncharacterized protein (TIGR03067 family)